MMHLHGFCVRQIEEVPVVEEVPEPEPVPVPEPTESSNDSLETPEENEDNQNETEGSSHDFATNKL